MGVLAVGRRGRCVAEGRRLAGWAGGAGVGAEVRPSGRGGRERRARGPRREARRGLDGATTRGGEGGGGQPDKAKTGADRLARMKYGATKNPR